jgi:hypothetical protein
MGSSSKKRQTFAKMTRERMVKEKRALKQEKKEAKKLAAAIEAEIGAGPVVSPDVDEDGQIGAGTVVSPDAEDDQPST